MRVENLISEITLPGEPGVFYVKVKDEQKSLDRARMFIRDKIARERKWGKVWDVEVTLEVHYQRRSIGQNKLHWALCAIMSAEQNDGDEGFREEYHEAILQAYSDRVPSRLNPAVRVPKRSHAMTTVEMSRLILGDFHELSQMGVDLQNAERIRGYWIEWNNWRSRQSVDPMSEAYRTIEEYRSMVTYCEACLGPVQKADERGGYVYTGQMAHIVSRGAGGADDLWNRFHLCTDCHLSLQHQSGWLALLGRYPHLTHKVAAAYRQAGARAVFEIVDVPGWELVVKEIGRQREGEDDGGRDSGGTVDAGGAGGHDAGGLGPVEIPADSGSPAHADEAPGGTAGGRGGTGMPEEHQGELGLTRDGGLDDPTVRALTR